LSQSYGLWSMDKQRNMQNFNTEASRTFLYKYLNNASPTGFEASGQQIWLDYIKPYVDSYFTDSYGTVVGVINPEAEYKVVIEAHADEISWFVNYINGEGYIYVRRNGGSDHMIAPSMRVNIHTDNAVIPGVFGWPAIHVRKEGKEEGPTLDNIFIDVGARNKEEVEALGVHVGCVITFKDELQELNGKFYSGRALDNRIGGYMIAQVARKIQEAGLKLPFRFIYSQCCAGGNRASWCRNDCRSDQAKCCDHHRCVPRYYCTDVFQNNKWRAGSGKRSCLDLRCCSPQKVIGFGYRIRQEKQHSVPKGSSFQKYRNRYRCFCLFQ
jgi:hypothetical protein